MKTVLSIACVLFCSIAFCQISLTESHTDATCFGAANASATITPSGGNAPYTYTLSSPLQTNGAGVFSALTAGTYTVIVEDAIATTNSIVVTITEPTIFTANITSVNDVTCFGLGNGSATASPIGGIGGPYIYSWTPSGQTSATATNLFPGTYSLTIIDFGGCTATATVNINQPSQLGSLTNVINVRCFGTATGTVSATGTGGSLPYTYFWPTLASTVSTVNNVAVGVYSVIVTDANNCSVSQTIAVIEPTQITTANTVTASACGGLCNGAFNIVPSGGSAPYTTTVSNGATTFYNSNQCAGSYTVTITDASNCVFTNIVSVPLLSSITAAISSTNSNCGQSNGSVCANVTGAVGATTFIWNNLSSSSCINLIPAGAYSYTVTDSNGCTASANTLVTSIGGPTVSISSQTNVSCFGLCSGTAVAFASGGTSPYNYSWSQGAVSPTATNLCAGLYNITVTDASGCIGTASVIITQPTAPNLFLISSTNPTCFGQCNGFATVSGTGGTPPYSYTWSGSGGNSSTSNPLCSGNYGAIMTDASGCSATTSVSITDPPVLTTTITSINGTCGTNCNGSASVNVFGGNAPYTISSTGPVNINSINPTNLCAGIYTVTTTDNSGCTFSSMLNINSLGSNTITNVTSIITSYDETCLQSNDGAIDLSITGSNPGPFTYQWSNGANTQDLNNISSNTYWVIIIDGSSNCLVLKDTVNAIGTNCGSISGKVYLDNNSDCIANGADYNLGNVLITANPGNKLGYTNANGDYIINNLPFGTYSITSAVNNTIYIATCSTALSATINSTIPNVTNANFAREFVPIAQPDLWVAAHSIGIVPGFVCRVNYMLHNYNTFNANGIFKVTLPSAFIPNIVNAFPASYIVSGDTVIWNFTNINYNNYNVNFYIDFTTPLSTPLGSAFSTCMWAEPAVTDLNYLNNTYCYSRLVTGSFDPNDKTVNPIGIGANGEISASITDLTYLIRFQNTGNGPAVNIEVKDTLSPNVDISSLEMLSASHMYDIDILSGNVLRWKFNNIMLPDSNSNEPASHGYIQYRIKRNSNNAPGTQIKNTAYIYFDFNAPVVTNTAINTIETVTGIQSISNDNELSVYPNPTNSILNIIDKNHQYKNSIIEIKNYLGQSVFRSPFTSQLDLSGLSAGIYLLTLHGTGNKKTVKIIKQ